MSFFIFFLVVRNTGCPIILTRSAVVTYINRSDKRYGTPGSFTWNPLATLPWTVYFSQQSHDCSRPSFLKTTYSYANAQWNNDLMEWFIERIINGLNNLMEWLNEWIHEWKDKWMMNEKWNWITTNQYIMNE